MEVKKLRESLYFACTVQFWRMAVLWTLSLIISYLQLLIQSFLSAKSKSDAHFNLSQLPRTTITATPSTAATRMPICIITGITSGLGAAAALALSKEGFYIVLVGRSSHLLSKAMSDIRTQNKDAQLKGFQVDLSSFQSIMLFKGSLQQWLLDSEMHSSVQLLINNAGIIATSCRLTTEGYDDIWCSVCILLFSYELHRQLDLMENSQQVSVIAADPGVVKTNIMREFPSCLSQFAFCVLKLLGLLQSPDIGVRSIVDAALAPPEISGVYFFGGNGRTLDSSALSYNAKLAKELWATSCELFQESLLASNSSST